MVLTTFSVFKTQVIYAFKRLNDRPILKSVENQPQRSCVIHKGFVMHTKLGNNMCETQNSEQVQMNNQSLQQMHNATCVF